MMKAQLLAFVKVLPEMMARAPEWTEILHYRIWNDESARVLYREILLDQDLEVGKIVEAFNADISENDPAAARAPRDRADLSSLIPTDN